MSDKSLQELIKTRLMGVAPDSQDLVLEDSDWAEIILALDKANGSKKTMMESLWSHCRKFIDDQEIRCAEAVSQEDRVITNAYEFIEIVCEIVGYYSDED